MSQLKDLCTKLELKIQESYQSGTTLEEAERLASEFLYAQIQVSQELQNADLDARMKKAGLKTIRAAVYLGILQKNEKKPTEAQITAMIDSDEISISQQEDLDTAEAHHDMLERYYNIFREAHIHYRSISRGRFE